MKLKWSKKKPDKYGFYWMKDLESKGKTIIETDGLYIFWTTINREVVIRVPIIEFKTCEWAGPIQEPKEQESG